MFHAAKQWAAWEKTNRAYPFAFQPKCIRNDVNAIHKCCNRYGPKESFFLVAKMYCPVSLS